MANQNNKILYVQPLNQYTFARFMAAIREAAATSDQKEIIDKIERKYGCGVIDETAKCFWTDGGRRVTFRILGKKLIDKENPTERLRLDISVTALPDSFWEDHRDWLESKNYFDMKFYIPEGVNTSI